MQKFVAAIVGIIFVAVGIFMCVRNNNLIKNCTVEAEAVVVDMEEEISTDSDGSMYLYYPVVEYKVGEETIRTKMKTNNPTTPVSANISRTKLWE